MKSEETRERYVKEESENMDTGLRMSNMCVTSRRMEEGQKESASILKEIMVEEFAKVGKDTKL